MNLHIVNNSFILSLCFEDFSFKYDVKFLKHSKALL